MKRHSTRTDREKGTKVKCCPSSEIPKFMYIWIVSVSPSLFPPTVEREYYFYTQLGKYAGKRDVELIKLSRISCYKK